MQLIGLWLASLSHSLGLLAALAAMLVVGIVAAPDGAGPGDSGDPDPAGAGDGGADPTDAGGDPGDDPDRLSAGGDDDPDPGAGGDPDDDEDEVDVRTLPENTLRNRYGRFRKWKKRVEPVVSLLRTDQGYMSPREVQDALSRARDMAELEQILESDPDLTQAILDARSGRRRSPARGANEPDPDAFDETRVPFDVADENGKYFLQQARDVHQLKTTIKQLMQRLDQAEGREGSRAVMETESGWKTQTLTAVRDLPEEYKLAVVGIVQARFEALKARRQLGRVKADQVIREAMAPFRRFLKGRTRAAAATSQARATSNQQRPGAVTRGTSVARPSDSNADRKETLKDARRSFFARIGASPAPGGR